MLKIFKMAVRNTHRYARRSLLIVSLIAVGVVFVQVYMAVTNSYKNLIISQITDSMLGHIQVHKKGYLVSVENVPLNMNLTAEQTARAEAILKANPMVESYSTRIKLGGMISNFAETTNIRLAAINPGEEFKTVPLLPSRVLEGNSNLKPGEALVPELLAKGMKLKTGVTVVLVATNKDGSVNGKQFTIGGIIETAPGPGGRDGYILLADAMELLRMDPPEVSEIAVRLKDFGKLEPAFNALMKAFMQEKTKDGKPVFEIHTWEKLSPFSAIAKMINMMTLMVKIMLVAIVLIGIMNVMIMSVYERTREIGTIAAIGTQPNTILAMFMAEGLCLGAAGVIAGNILSVAVIYGVRLMHVTFAFGMREGFVLTPAVNPVDFSIISAIVLAVAVFGSLQPAWKASRMEPVKALKSI